MRRFGPPPRHNLARVLLLVLTLVSALVVQLASPFSTSAQGSTTLIDIVGRSVTVKTPVQRVIMAEGRQTYIVASLDTDNPFKRVVGWGDDLRTADFDSYVKYQEKFPGLTQIPILGSPAERHLQRGEGR